VWSAWLATTGGVMGTQYAVKRGRSDLLTLNPLFFAIRAPECRADTSLSCGPWQILLPVNC